MCRCWMAAAYVHACIWQQVQQQGAFLQRPVDPRSALLRHGPVWPLWPASSPPSGMHQVHSSQPYCAPKLHSALALIPRLTLPLAAALSPGLREVVVEGAYTLVLEFESTLEMAQWEERQPKIESFFGPGVVAKLDKTSTGVDVSLICNGSGAGRGGGDRPDVLPPLMPGLKPRQQ